MLLPGPQSEGETGKFPPSEIQVQLLGAVQVTIILPHPQNRAKTTYKYFVLPENFS